MRLVPWLLAALFLGLSGVLVTQDFSPLPPPKAAVIKKVTLPAKFGPGDLLMATARLKPVNSFFYEDKERGVLVQVEQYADKVKGQPTVAFQVYYFDVLPPKGGGHPVELAG